MLKLRVPLLLLVLAFAGCKSSILDDPSTTIPFTISERSHVKLTLDNSYNTTVAVIVDEDQAAGQYQAITTNMKLPEGLYFWTLEVRGLESGSYSKKVIHTVLVK